MRHVVRRIPDEVGPRQFVAYLRKLAHANGSAVLATHLKLYERLPFYAEPTWKIGESKPDTPVVACDLPHVPFAPIPKWYGPQQPSDLDPAKETRNLIANAETLDIGVTWSRFDPRLAGFIGELRYRRGFRRDLRKPPPELDSREQARVVMGKAVIGLNEVQTWTTTFEVLLHELAHLLLGHLSGWSTRRSRSVTVPDRAHVPHKAREVEACAVSYLVSRRRGCAPELVTTGNKSEQHLRLQYALAYVKHELHHVDLLQIAKVADILTAWCQEPPESAAFSILDYLGDGPPNGSWNEVTQRALGSSLLGEDVMTLGRRWSRVPNVDRAGVKRD